MALFVSDPLSKRRTFFDHEKRLLTYLTYIKEFTPIYFGPCLFGLHPNGLFTFGLSPFGLPMTFGLSPFELF